MVHGVHADAADLTVRIDGVPALPDRCGTHVDLIQPAGIFLVQKQRVGFCIRAVIGERAAQHRRAEEAGLQLAFIHREQAAQGFGDLLACELRRKPKRKRNGVAGLRCGRAPAARSVKLAADGVENFVCTLFVDVVLSRFAERACGICNAHGALIVVGGAQERDVRAAENRLGIEAGFRAVQCEPIGKVELNARPQACCAVRFVVAVDPICPQLHALEAVFEHADVARCNVGFPRDDGCGVCPAAVTAAVCEHRVCFARLAADEQRGDIRHLAVEALLFLQKVSDILRIERAAIHVVVRRGAERLRVARPAHALVALRAVGRHVEEVIALAPDRVQVQAVDLLVCGRDLAGLLEVGIKRPHLNIRDAGEVCHAGEFDVAEAVEGRNRSNKGFFARRNIAVFGKRSAQVIAVEAVILQQLAGLHAQLDTCGQVGHEREPPRNVLAEVEHKLVFRRGDLLRGDDMLCFYGQREARGNCAEVRRGVALHRLPICIGAGRRAPVFDFEVRIVALAVVDVAERQRVRRALPAFVRDDDGLALRGGNVQFTEEQVFLCVHIAGFSREIRFVIADDAVKTKAAFRPAVAQNGADDVFAGVNEVGHVVSLVLNPAVVGGATGGKILIVRLFAVQIELVDAETREVCAGRENFAGNLKRAAHVRGGVRRKARRNTLCRERLVELCGLEPRSVACDQFTVIAHNGNAPEVARAGLEGDFHRYTEGRRGFARAGIKDNIGKILRFGNLHARPKLLFRFGIRDCPRDVRRFQIKTERVDDTVCFHSLNFHVPFLSVRLHVRLFPLPLRIPAA